MEERRYLKDGDSENRLYRKLKSTTLTVDKQQIISKPKDYKGEGKATRRQEEEAPKKLGLNVNGKSCKFETVFIIKGIETTSYSHIHGNIPNCLLIILFFEIMKIFIAQIMLQKYKLCN